jgi:hypothetical protein
MRTAAEPKDVSWKWIILSTKKNQQASSGKLLLELAEPWSRLQQHKRKWKLTKKGTSGLTNGCNDEIAGTEDRQEHPLAAAAQNHGARRRRSAHGGTVARGNTAGQP